MSAIAQIVPLGTCEVKGEILCEGLDTDCAVAQTVRMAHPPEDTKNPVHTRPRSSYDWVDDALMGNLHNRLRSYRDQGLSNPQIAEKFNEDGFVVSREMVRRWMKRAGIDNG